MTARSTAQNRRLPMGLSSAAHALTNDIVVSALLRIDPVERLGVDVLRAWEKGRKAHAMLVGQPGCGKSHALRALAITFEQALKHTGAKAVHVLLDDATVITSVLDFVVRVLELMEPQGDGGPLFFDTPADTAVPDLARISSTEWRHALNQTPEPARVERALQSVRSKLAGDSLVIAVDDLHLILRSLGKARCDELSQIVEREGWLLLASSPMDAEPERLAFRKVELRPYDVASCRDMLRRRAAAKPHADLARLYLDNPASLVHLEVVDHLLGLTPQTALDFFSALVTSSHDSGILLEPALYELADRYRLLYLERLRDLSPGQRKLFSRLADHWRPLTVSDLAFLTLSTPQNVSSQLRHLSNHGLVHAMQLGRERFYEVTDPRIALHRALRQPERGPASILVGVLEQWCALEPGSPSDLAQKVLASSREVLEAFYALHSSYRPFVKLARPERSLIRAATAAVGGVYGKFKNQLPREFTDPVRARTKRARPLF
ncbi:MAG: hypothetical protein COW42_00575 [Deltaproteobacteria bacterium CG17_big_fil_post_rev_8_21_14_2_50_63_7]|nr:MAG: hypothetical protein COW42_00575 [Deltaproteobacteria bacterium CG17_big_fil_post_rev_8_21_14_2_50_63_7]